MRKLSIFLVIVASIVLVCKHESKADQVVKSYKTGQPLLVDGIGTDDAWKNAAAVTTFDPIAGVEINIKSAYDDTNIYFLVSYPDKDESRTHRNWTWSKEENRYKEGPEREDVLVFKWRLDEKTQDLSIFSDDPYEADVWFWKACRTDSLGFADDKIQRLYSYPSKDTLEVTSRSGKKMYIQRQGDRGKSAYRTQIFIDYEGDVVPRFTFRQPESSRADIRAKGAWKDGRWTIEFARALVTGNADDVNFQSLKKSYGFGISRYEIAGRPREDDSEQPLYGSGDITEILILEFH